MTNPSFYIHPTAEVSSDAYNGAGTRIWRQAHVREYAHIDETCSIGKGVYIDTHVHIGSNAKIQNHASLFEGLTLKDGVFIGPHVCFTNDVLPRAITPLGQVKGQDDWVVGTILIRYGASIGAGSIILPNVTIGRFAMIGAGSVVTRSVPDYALVYGNPARRYGYACHCGQRLAKVEQFSDSLV